MPRPKNPTPYLTIGVAVHPAVKERIADEAVRAGLSPTSYCRAILHQWFLEGRGVDYTAVADRTTFEDILAAEPKAVTA